MPGIRPGQHIGGVSPQITHPSTSVKTAHSFLVGLLGQLAGVSILAIFADANDEIGGFAVAIMAGWFLLFIMINAQDLSKAVKYL